MQSKSQQNPLILQTSGRKGVQISGFGCAGRLCNQIATKIANIADLRPERSAKLAVLVAQAGCATKIATTTASSADLRPEVCKLAVLVAILVAQGQIHNQNR